MAIQITRQPDYRDLDLTFTSHPVTGDIAKKVGPQAVVRAVRHLVLTNFYERPFRASLGSNAVKLLFDLVNPITATFLENAIAEVINNFEPRVQLIRVQVGVDPDGNGYQAEITFLIRNMSAPLTTTLFLKRLR
jgi:phage baseplate assembly protein W